MRKRNMKFMAMFLSLTMVFSMNTFAFGSEASLDEVPGEAVQAEVTEGEEPEVVGIAPDDGDQASADYHAGFQAGETAAAADQANGNKDAHDSDVDGAKSELYKNKAYAAGFEDGYSAYKLHQPIDAYENGFNLGYRMIIFQGEKAVTDYKADKDTDPGYNKMTGKDSDYLTAYQKAFDEGVTVGRSVRLDAAYERGANLFNFIVDDLLDDIFKTWKNADSYLKSDDFKGIFDYKTEYKECGDDFIAKFEEGFKAEFEAKAKTEGLRDGKIDGQQDGTTGYVAVSTHGSEANVDDYIAKSVDPGDAAAYKDHWSIYKKQYKTVESGAAEIANTTVGETYITNYISGYDAVYTNASDKAKNQAEKDAYNLGFSDGYAIGLLDGPTNTNENRETDEKEGAGHRWGTYVITNAEANKDTIESYKAGYNKGYDVAKFDKTEEDGYNDGYESGAYDANHDQYTGYQYAGFYEIGTPGSAYETVDPNTSYGKGYRAGYKDGYDTVINNAKLNKRQAKPFDYTAADMDAWRISTDPAKWDTTQILINESAVGASESLFFDTRSLADTWTNNNPTVQFRDRDKNPAGAAEIVATSPFQYYFDLYGQDHLVDKKTVSYNLPVIDNVYVNGKGINRGSIGQYMYAALSASSNKAKKPKKGVSDNGTTYILLRYRLVGAETDENYKVKRYAYDANGTETVVVDTINDYYQGENGSEPVVNYDSRKIAGVKRDKDNNILGNDKANRYVIDAEALVVTWQEGAPAKLIGKLDLNVSPKDNINATVPHNYLEFLGDTDILEKGMPRNAANDNQNAVEFVQDDKDYFEDDTVWPVLITSYSKYYTVTESNKDRSNDKKGIMGVVKFAGTKSAPKLTTAESAYVSKKGAAPSFTLKAKTKDPELKAYMKDAKQALKKATFNFEISRMKLASDYISDADKGNIPLGENGPYAVPFEYEDTVVANLLNAKFAVAPKRSECGSNAEYEKKVEAYIKARAEYNNYKNTEEFKKAARAEFKKAVEAYQAEYNTLKTKYGSKLDTLQKYIEENWALLDANNDITFGYFDGDGLGHSYIAENVVFPYTVTKPDRMPDWDDDGDADELVPIGNTPKYKETVPEDANCDGIITAIEHYEYVEVVNGDTTDPRFDGKLEAGDNIAADYDLVNGKIDFDNVVVGVNDGEEGVDEITFTYNYDVDDRVNQDGHIRIKYMNLNEITNQNVSEALFGKYLYELGTAVGWGVRYAIMGFAVDIDFLEDQATDIDIVEQNENIKVLYPGTARAYDGTEGWDLVEVSFKDPKAKISKNPAKKPSTLTVKPVLIINTTDNKGFEDTAPAVVKNVKTEKKLKVYTTKPGVSANKAGKMPKADVQIDPKMAETEPFIVATGINNFEGSIAIRQRKNGELGYGYFKDDDFYYIFSDED